MLHFHLLRVKKVEKETDDSVSIVFDVPAELKDTFQFKPGQSLTVRKTLGGAEQRRNYSICSSPSEGLLRIAVKKVDGGLFSTWANEQLQPGDQLEVMPPIGKFSPQLHPANKKRYLAFAAGSGITPLLSIIKTTLETEPSSSFILVYGNRTKNSIIFKEELQDLKDRYLNRFSLYHILSRERTESELNHGRIDSVRLDTLFSKLIELKKIDDFFLCGPEEMIFLVRNYLQERTIEPEKIHFELFTIPGQKQSVKQTRTEKVEDSGPMSNVSVKLDGIMFDFELGYDSLSLLDAALKQGADLPYACKGGVCTTCKARLKEGEIVMDVNWGLEPDEIARGFILTCQAHPRSERLIVDFDSK